jgi:hypothetical protein
LLYFGSGLRRGTKGGEEGLGMLKTSIISEDINIGLDTGCKEQSRGKRKINPLPPG